MNDVSLFIHLSPSSGVPIYRQVIEQIERLVSGGQLKPGDALPSVRKLAKQLEVNPMTLSKAYSLLEAEGLLERRRGVGMLIAMPASGQAAPQTPTTLLEPILREATLQARQLGISKQDALALFETMFEEAT